MIEVYYSPHTDDETIGMAGMIARGRMNGRDTMLVLVTDNQASERARAIFPDRPDLAGDRVAEFRRATAALHVDKVRYLGIPESAMVDDRRFSIERIAAVMAIIDREFGGRVVHHGVQGDQDIHAELGRGTLAHAVCASGARLFKTRHAKAQVVLHSVYAYSFPIIDRWAPAVVDLSSEEMACKRAAIDAYRPGENSIGYGYRSVPELFDGAAADPREFLEPL